jgi:hypothetical protein
MAFEHERVHSHRRNGTVGGFGWMKSVGKKGVVVPLVGFELTTYRLQGGCSTN